MVTRVEQLCYYLDGSHLKTGSNDEFIEQFHTENGPHFAIFLRYEEDLCMKTCPWGLLPA